MNLSFRILESLEEICEAVSLTTSLISIDLSKVNKIVHGTCSFLAYKFLRFFSE